MISEFNLEGKRAIVTGASRGIGKEIVRCLAEAGADVVCAARTMEELEQTVREVKALGRNAIAVKTDVTKLEEVRRMVERALEAMGEVHILVNNAGISRMGTVVPLSQLQIQFPKLAYEPNSLLPEEVWRAIIDVNLTGPFLCCQAIAPHMIEKRRGKIINISSLSAKLAEPYRHAYNASKAGLNMLTRVLALEWAPYNINVNAIGPGYIYTAMSARHWDNPEVRAARLKTIPLGRVGTTREVALAAVYLASPASDYMTGQCMYLGGGREA